MRDSPSMHAGREVEVARKAGNAGARGAVSHHQGGRHGSWCAPGCMCGSRSSSSWSSTRMVMLVTRWWMAGDSQGPAFMSISLEEFPVFFGSSFSTHLRV